MSRVGIGYLCCRGHFQLNGDPEGDQCSSKNVGEIYVEVTDDADLDYVKEIIEEALDSHNRKLEVWRRSY